MNVKKLLFFLASLVFFIDFSSANIFNRPRKVKVLSTEYFDFIFPDEGEKIAFYLAENADSFFENAAKKINLQKTFRIPVAITLDSDFLEVEYTPIPYNRITVYASQGNAKIYQENALLDEFHEEIVKAVFSSKRSKFWEFTHSVTRLDAIQPVKYLNVPSSFLEGAVNLSVYENSGVLKDGFSLSLLSEAKKENTFPSWIDAAGSKDDYPSKISSVAYCAFCAYLQNRFGFEKFEEFFEKSGRLNFFRITRGIFKSVYKIPIEEAWKDFENEIPNASETKIGENLLENDIESSYGLFCAENDLVIFYDALHSEVGRIDAKSEKPERKKLFSAQKITSLSVSDDFENLLVSYDSTKTNRTLTKKEALVFDLKKKLFYKQSYPLKNAAIINYSLEKKAVAGFSADGIYPSIKIFPFDENESENLIYEKRLSSSLKDSIQPEGIVPLGIGQILAIYYSNGKCILHFLDIFYETEKLYEFPFNARNLKKEKSPENFKISFTFAENSSYEQAKRGFFTIDHGGKINDVFLQKDDFQGGIHNSIEIDDKIYFSSHRAKWEEIKFVDSEKIEYIKGKNVLELENKIAATENDFTESKNEFSNRYKISKYNPMKYSLRGTLIPFVPISRINFTTPELALGLGATYYTKADPLDNFTTAISGCAGFIDTNAETLTVKDEYTVSALANLSFLPFDITVAGLWNFTNDGRYNLQAFLGTDWNSIVGLPQNKLSFGVKWLWDASTTYYDYENETVLELSEWPIISDAYNTFRIRGNVNYTNVRQYGKSSFEKSGITTEVALTLLIDTQKEKKEENEFGSYVLYGSYSFAFNLPFLVPIYGLEDWIICFPFEAGTNWLSETESIMESYAEVLLLGYEVQKGIPILNIYIHRLGIKLGYDAKIKYNTLITEDPTFFDLKSVAESLKNSDYEDYAYISLEVGFSPVIGSFSKDAKITAGVQFRLNIRETEGSVNAILKMNL